VSLTEIYLGLGFALAVVFVLRTGPGLLAAGTRRRAVLLRAMLVWLAWGPLLALLVLLGIRKAVRHLRPPGP